MKWPQIKKNILWVLCLIQRRNKRNKFWIFIYFFFYIFSFFFLNIECWKVALSINSFITHQSILKHFRCRSMNKASNTINFMSLLQSILFETAITDIIVQIHLRKQKRQIENYIRLKVILFVSLTNWCWNERDQSVYHDYCITYFMRTRMRY